MEPLNSMKPLSRREWEVVELLLQGKSNKLIALALGISDRTVEFHLKNIYAKYQVSSRVELILFLGNTPGRLKTGQLGSSTVDSSREIAENGDRSRPDPAVSINSDPLTGQESKMKNLTSRQALTGVIAALLTGLTWATLLKHFGHMSNSSIAPWVVPIFLALVILGAAVGLAAKRNGNGVGKVFFSTVFGTGAGAFAMIPLVGSVLYPLAKLGEALGLINRAAVSTEMTSILVILAMIAVWLVVGAAVGIFTLHLGFKRAQPAAAQKTAGQSV